MRIALIISTYNRPDALAAVLEGCLFQTDANFEVIIADDGSKEETAILIQTYQTKASFPIRHIWQEDIGFRLAAIRNRAIAATYADYIIFTDGDCIPPPSFIASHRRLAEKGWFLTGSRLLLNEAMTQKVLETKLPIHQWRKIDWLKARLRGQVSRLLPLLALPQCPTLRKCSPKKWQGAKGCNISAWREDLFTINGMDESYIGWGLEDSDLIIRLLRARVYRKSARFTVPVLHLWHPENDRSHLEENQQRLQTVLNSTHIRAKLGLDQY